MDSLFDRVILEKSGAEYYPTSTTAGGSRVLEKVSIHPPSCVLASLHCFLFSFFFLFDMSLL